MTAYALMTTAACSDGGGVSASLIMAFALKNLPYHGNQACMLDRTIQHDISMEEIQRFKRCFLRVFIYALLGGRENFFLRDMYGIVLYCLLYSLIDLEPGQKTILYSYLLCRQPKRERNRKTAAGLML